MKNFLSVAVVLGCAVAGCSKKSNDQGAGSSSAAAKATNEPATTTEPAATDDKANADKAAAEKAAKEKAEQEQADKEKADKAEAIKVAMEEDKILNDPQGQWATSATASSTYKPDSDPNKPDDWGPGAATGAPNVEHYGDSSKAWAPQTKDKGLEWLELKFEKPVQATELRVRQNSNPGTIIKIELIDEAGAKHTVWEGQDDTKYDTKRVPWLFKTFEKTTYKATGARLTLATNAQTGWEEIDAVQLIGE